MRKSLNLPFTGSKPLLLLLHALSDSLQTPVYALYPPATIATAVIFLTCRQLQVSLPSDPEHPWWELFDSDLEDIMSICGYIQRLYRPRSDKEKRLAMTLVSKKELRKWLDYEGSSRSQ